MIRIQAVCSNPSCTLDICDVAYTLEIDKHEINSVHRNATITESYSYVLCPLCYNALGLNTAQEDNYASPTSCTSIT